MHMILFNSQITCQTTNWSSGGFFPQSSCRKLLSGAKVHMGEEEMHFTFGQRKRNDLHLDLVGKRQPWGATKVCGVGCLFSNIWKRKTYWCHRMGPDDGIMKRAWWCQRAKPSGKTIVMQQWKGSVLHLGPSSRRQSSGDQWVKRAKLQHLGW